MQIDRIAVMLRPRNHWEAMDLGMRMAVQWWRPVFGAWLALYLPVIAVITLVCVELQNPWLAMLLVWWVKPLMERAPLYVMSHAVFGDTPRLGEAIRAIPGLLRISPLWRLLLGRFTFNRSFCLPVILLEGLKGKERRERLRVLGKGMSSAPLWFTIVCVHFEQFLAFGAYGLLNLLVPSEVEARFGIKELFTQGMPDWMLWMLYSMTVLAYLIIGPFYVGGGFGLYLNRRTWLESWDIELGFRRMAQRLEKIKGMTPAVLVMLCLIGLGSLPQPVQAAPQPPQAAPDSESARAHIDAVLKRPEFATKKTIEEWRYKGELDEPKPRENDDGLSSGISALESFVKGIAWILKGAFYLLLIAIVVWLLIHHERWLNWMRGIKPQPRYQAPAQLFGLDIRPESLPKNIAATAYQLWQSGDARGALSLLYRGALSRLAQQEQVQLKASDTEGDCLQLVQRTQAADLSGYFEQLTGAWQAVAYAGRTPQTDLGEALCRNYDAHFGAGT